MTDPTRRCPCEDGLPDPCTLCGVPADGVCGLDTVVEFEHRAKKAEAELASLSPALLEEAKQPGWLICRMADAEHNGWEGHKNYMALHPTEAIAAIIEQARQNWLWGDEWVHVLRQEESRHAEELAKAVQAERERCLALVDEVDTFDVVSPQAHESTDDYFSGWEQAIGAVRAKIGAVE